MQYLLGQGIVFLTDGSTNTMMCLGELVYTYATPLQHVWFKENLSWYVHSY